MRYVLLLFISLSVAQAAPMNLSLQAIGIYSSFDNMLLPECSWIRNFYADARYGLGATLDIPLRGSLSIETGALYVIRGFSEDATVIATGEYVKPLYMLPTLEIPVVLKIQKPSGLLLGAGAYMASVLSPVTRRYSGSDDAIATSATSFNIADRDWGATMLLGYRTADPLGIRADLRLYYGLADIGVASSGTHVRFMAAELLLGINFKI